MIGVNKSKHAVRSDRPGVNANRTQPAPSPTRCHTYWRCSECGKTLGLRVGDTVEIVYGRRHRYRAALPAAADCPRCRTRNTLP